MDRLSQAQALTNRAEHAIADMEATYRVNLRDQNVSDALLIDVKNTVENLRSALDYVAHAIYDVVGDGTSRKIYFPIAFEQAVSADFPSLANRQIPGVVARPDLTDYLASVQAFTAAGNDWLPKLATLTNENKHSHLSPQRRTETVRRTAKTSGGGSVSWNPANVTFGPGVFIGGVPVDASTQMPVPSPFVETNTEIWVDFVFDATNESVLAFLKRATHGVHEFITGLPEL
jgi:hypothetical protein